MPDGLLHQCAIDSLSDGVPSCAEVARSTCDLPSGASAPARDPVRTSRGPSDAHLRRTQGAAVEAGVGRSA
ncbi:hypothetical protein [Streptomyces chattanoogensis]|uniref:hypothetical protein n=1 Tax=Streptomyces chattanoogensis TaxID=66876 RepID=UPI000A5F0289|nr:hypothetical protein [Streptomyces chattanoogensis]